MRTFEGLAAFALQTLNLKYTIFKRILEVMKSPFDSKPYTKIKDPFILPLLLLFTQSIWIVHTSLHNMSAVQGRKSTM